MIVGFILNLSVSLQLPFKFSRTMTDLTHRHTHKANYFFLWKSNKDCQRVYHALENPDQHSATVFITPCCKYYDTPVAAPYEKIYSKKYYIYFKMLQPRIYLLLISLMCHTYQFITQLLTFRHFCRVCPFRITTGVFFQPSAEYARITTGHHHPHETLLCRQER
jgi:hypothetical protein